MVNIITDSAADFEPLELQLLNVKAVPMSVTFGNVTYRENINLTKRMFYNLILIQPQPPTTSQPSPADFEEVFKDKNSESVAILLSSRISGTYQCGKYIADNNNKIHIIDSKTASAGQRLLVEEAVRLRNKGCNGREIVSHIEKLKNKIRLFAVVENSSFMKKGGRLPHTAHKINNIKNIKPVITLEDGEVKLKHKALGTKRAIEYMIRQLKKYPPDMKYPFHIMYANNHSIGVAVKEMIMDSGFPMTNHSLVNIGATVGSHIGVGSCGIVYVEK